MPDLESSVFCQTCCKAMVGILATESTTGLEKSWSRKPAAKTSHLARSVLVQNHFRTYILTSKGEICHKSGDGCIYRHLNETTKTEVPNRGHVSLPVDNASLIITLDKCYFFDHLFISTLKMLISLKFEKKYILLFSAL